MFSSLGVLGGLRGLWGLRGLCFQDTPPERGQSWESVAQQLNSINQPSFGVTTRSIRDQLTLLSTKYAQNLRMEEKASGIDVEQTDLDSLLEEILEREKEAKKDLESKDRDKKSKVEKEKATAEEVRKRGKRALERMAKPKVEDPAPVVQRLDNAIHRINRYPVGKCWQNKPRYPLDSDLSSG